ncbi:hypothetical protein [Rudanella lutea]|uniref:hypothetical protein n=1 Tax=Rudanella lutea TaxID=451374 RepID=UPI0003A888A1|nr:hypothetical protein [Rudanella lutea]
MKPATIYFALFLVLSYSLSGFAQTDSLTLGDTISMNRRSSLFGPPRQYGYHHATALNSQQLVSFLERNADSEGNRLVRRYKTLHAITKAIPFVVLGGFTGSILLNRDNHPQARSLLLSSAVLAYVPLFIPVEKSMERAVRQYNGRLRGQFSAYYQPVVALIPSSERLTLADTVSIKGIGIRPRFTYRGIRVEPATNLRTAFDYLNSGRINSNLRYVRTARRVAGLVSSLAVGVLSGYFVGYALRGASYPVNRAIVYPAASVIGASTLAIWHTNYIQAGTMHEYNLKIKERVNSSREE